LPLLALLSGESRGASSTLANTSETLSPEITVLVCCARKQLGDAERLRLTELVHQPLDGDLLLRLADDHGLVPLLEHHLRGTETSGMPQGFLLRVRRAAREHSIRAFFLSVELLRVIGAFRKAGISAIPYKGPELAMRAYGDASLRSFADLDIVIPQKFMPAVHENMALLGYGTKLLRKQIDAHGPRDVPGEYAFVHETNRARVEVHTEYTLRHFPGIADVNAMIGRATSLKLNGKEVPVFAVEDELLILAVHGAKDLWARLLWVADLAELVKQSNQIDWEGVFARAASMKLSRMLRVSLILASETLGLMLPSVVSGKLGRDLPAKQLAAKIRRQLLGFTRIRGGVLERSLYRIRMADGFWPGVSYWLRLSTTPVEEDWSERELPQRLRQSYALLRPLRLLRKYGQHVSHSK
jgi:hypothetical protein